MFEITILDHNFSLLSDIPTNLKDLLSYSHKSYNRRTRKWRFDYHSLIDFDSNCVYTGVVPYILEHFKGVKVIDKRVFPEGNFVVPKLSTPLRDYQIDYVVASLRKERCVIHSSTGSGKTVIMAAILVAVNLPTLIMAPNNTVLAQLKTEIGNLIPGIVIGSTPGDKIVIGLARNFIKWDVNDLRKYQLLLIDEAHTVAAKQAHDVILSTNAPYRFGFTGTPTGRSDNADLLIQGLIGEIIKLIERKELVEKGYLSDVKVELYRASWDGDYTTLEDLLIVNNPKRNMIIQKIVSQHKTDRILILVRRIDHGEVLKKLIPGSVFIHGDSSTQEREEVRGLIKNNKLRVLIASNIFSTGLDIPQLELGINARGGKAEILTLQGAGRVVRPWEGICKIWVDIYDDYCYTMEEHSKERLRFYQEEGLPVNFINFPPGKQRILEHHA